MIPPGKADRRAKEWGPDARCRVVVDEALSPSSLSPARYRAAPAGVDAAAQAKVVPREAKTEDDAGGRRAGGESAVGNGARGATSAPRELPDLGGSPSERAGAEEAELGGLSPRLELASPPGEEDAPCDSSLLFSMLPVSAMMRRCPVPVGSISRTSRCLASWGIIRSNVGGPPEAAAERSGARTPLPRPAEPKNRVAAAFSRTGSSSSSEGKPESPLP